QQSPDQKWLAWRFRETRRRTGLFIWLNDCFLAIMTENPPTLLSRTFNLRIPCQEDLWQAGSAQDWACIAPSLLINAENDLYATEKADRALVWDLSQEFWQQLRRPEPTTQFATLVILHVILRQKWEPDHYKNDALNLVTADGLQVSWTHRNRYYGEFTEFMRWRNHTCDCLDILHWEALSEANRAGGLEGPNLLQLHLARLVILVPVRDLFDRVSALNPPSGPPNNHLPHSLYHLANPNSRWNRILFNWGHQDRYKARLAAVHAGAVLWHIRRYSVASLIEPYSIFLATLTL
ncbi:hypothetical protein BU24DRAFT_82026, partial [Aaosphaeria arxii CBS 175.79]